MVATKLTTYEEKRRQRLEENKRRMEQLHLPLLAQALQTSASPKRSPMKRTSKLPVLQKQVVELRRSGRVANMPAPVYKEIVTYERFDYPRRKCGPYKGGRSSNSIVSVEDRQRAALKAEELESSLGTEFPSFVKPMLPSHTSGGFWLGLPGYFCRENLPHRDETVTLVDEEGEEFPTVYLHNKIGLSGGWRGFSIDHELVDGDALVFQLIRPTVFKVYIIRLDDLKESNKNEPLEA